MGILDHTAKLIEGLGLPPGFSVVELGNQIYRVNGSKVWSNSWYERLGCGRYASIDANGRATHQADLNYPLPSGLGLGEFDLVTDFGTGEHIFDQAQVWKTLHALAKVGGLIAIDRPYQGWDAHCFYNIQRTLVEDIAAANDYRIAHLGVHEIQGHGLLLSAILEKTRAEPFKYPIQGKYRSMIQPHVKRWDVLAGLVHGCGWTRGAEIGVLNGATFFHLLDNAPDLHMIAVDNWSETDPVYGDLTKVGREFLAKAETYGARVRVWCGRSVDMAKRLEAASLDFCFIDASHDYDSVATDLDAWRPKVKPGGCLLGHDWNVRFPGVIRAVTERFGSPMLFPDHVWGVRC